MKFFIIQGGEYEDHWETVVMAETAAVAVTRLQMWHEHLNRMAGMDYTPDEPVEVYEAEVNALGIIDRRGEMPIVDGAKV